MRNCIIFIINFSRAYNSVIGCGVVSPVHGKDVVDGFNATDKSFLTMFMTTVQLSGTATNNSHMFIHTTISNTYISLARLFQKHITDPTCAHVFIDHLKYRKIYSKR